MKLFLQLSRIAVRGLSSRAVPPTGPPSSTVKGTTFATAVAQPKIQETIPGSEPRIVDVPLSEPLSAPLKHGGMSAGDSASAVVSDWSSSHLTVLPNGLRVATAPQVTEYCTIGVMIDAGCRYEAPYPSGVSHFIEKVAFCSTEEYPDGRQLFAALEANGGIIDCQAAKDLFIYASSCQASGSDAVLGLIADAALRPTLTEEEVEKTREVIKFDLQGISMDPNPERIITDLIHSAAYHDNTIGLPKYCPPENVDKITRNMLLTYLQSHYQPSRMVVAGVGVDHDAFVESTKKYFCDMRPSWESPENLVSTKSPIKPDESMAQYTGGVVKKEADLSDVALGPTPMPELAHFVLGLESSSYNDPDFVPFCILNSLMGGGGSFSSGGPGKGMYTRLYTNVLNRYYWMYNATSYNHVYSDTGLYCIHASSDPKKLAEVVSVIVTEFINMAGRIEKEELDRAKIQLQSMLLMNMEQRPVAFEDICRQILGRGHRKSPEEYMAEIRSVDMNDIKRVAERLLKSKAAVVAYGNPSSLPDYDKIDQALARRDPTVLKKSSFFSFGK